MNEWLLLIPAVALSVLLLAVFHWFPWVHRLPRLWAYRIGVACLWCGFALWRGIMGDWVTPLGLAAICVLAGYAVTCFYWIDDQLDDIGIDSRKARRGERMMRDDSATRE